MRFGRMVISWFALTALAACASAPALLQHVSIEHVGIIECFPAEKPGTDKKDWKRCDSSAVETILDKDKAVDKVLVVSDRKVPRDTFVQAFTVAARSLEHQLRIEEVSYYPVGLIQDTEKVEATAKSIDGEYAFATTAFDRDPGDSKDNFRFNRLLYWPAREPEKMRIANVSPGSEPYSAQVREKLREALADARYPNGPRYFKVEGLAALPDSWLLFGIRDMGCGFEAPFSQYVAKIIAARYSVQADGSIVLGNDFRLIGDFELKIPGREGPDLGLSSLEFRPPGELLLLTSGEEKDDSKPDAKHDGYLWHAKVRVSDDGPSIGLPVVYPDKDGAPLKFHYKPEGMTLLHPNRLMVIFDEDKKEELVDRMNVLRKWNEAIYHILALPN